MARLLTAGAHVGWSAHVAPAAGGSDGVIVWHDEGVVACQRATDGTALGSTVLLPGRLLRVPLQVVDDGTRFTLPAGR